MAAFEDKRVTAQEYMKEKKINEIFTHLTTKILYEKPDDPRKFLQAEIARMIESGITGGVNVVFTRSDLQTLFDMHAVSEQLDVEEIGKVFEKLGLPAPEAKEPMSAEDFFKAVEEAS